MAQTSNTILAIETATGPSGAALWRDGCILALAEHAGREMQSTVLFPLIEEVLQKSGLAYSDLTAIACTVGPGSFTGIRVGLAAARGICFAAKIPGLGFTTLETLAFAGGKKNTLAILNAGKGECYYQAFGADCSPLFAPRLGKMEEALASSPGAHVTGYGADQAAPRADALAELAATRESRAQPLLPFYIRPPDAKPVATRSVLL